MTAKINKSISHDRMTIKGILSSGANVKFTVNRSGEKLIAGLSNDPAIGRIQIQSLNSWLVLREDENNIGRFDRLQKVLEISRNSADLMNNLSKY